MIDVVFRINADADVEPRVAVDDILAVTAHDDVAAVTAKNDVAGGEGSYVVTECCIEERLQTVDEGDVGEGASPYGGADLAADEIDCIVAEQVVVVLGPR